MDTPQESFYNGPDLLHEIWDLFNEDPLIARQSPEAVNRALRKLRSVEAADFAPAATMDALRFEGEILI